MKKNHSASELEAIRKRVMPQKYRKLDFEKIKEEQQ